MATIRTWLAGTPERGALTALAVTMLTYAAFVIWRSSASSFYTIDDPYIHLALAENIARGHFGVNLGEASNPSSSILWPWLMAGFELAGFGVWAPLVVNVACFLASAALLIDFAGRTLGRTWQGFVFAGLVFLSVNLFGVVFTGLEHSLHVLVSLVVITRIIAGRYDRVLMAALVLSPLVRFEGAAVLALGLGAAMWDRRFAFAAAVLGLTAVFVGAYVAWMAALGLPALPSSVLVKSDISGTLADALARNLSHNLEHPASGMSALALVAAAALKRGRERVLALGLLGFLALALVFGPLGGYPRYEVYVFSAVAAGALHLFREELGRVLAKAPLAIALGLSVFAINGSFGWHALATTPQAARNINQQQHQMHRFIAGCWKQPVAVNDLGWASYGNDAYVLDLWGLASEEARAARKAGDAGWMEKLAAAHGVDAALIYSDWFADIPASWSKVGELRLTEVSASPARPVVDVYATRSEARAEVARCLAWLKADMPAGARVEILD